MFNVLGELGNRSVAIWDLDVIGNKGTVGY